MEEHSCVPPAQPPSGAAGGAEGVDHVAQGGPFDDAQGVALEEQALQRTLPPDFFSQFMYVLGPNELCGYPDRILSVPMCILLGLVVRRHLALSQAAMHALGIATQLEDTDQLLLMERAVDGGNVAVCRWVRQFCPLIEECNWDWMLSETYRQGGNPLLLQWLYEQRYPPH